MLSLPTHASPQTDSSSCRLLSTVPQSDDNAASTSNSVRVRRLGLSSRCTFRLSMLIRRAPNRRGGLRSWLGSESSVGVRRGGRRPRGSGPRLAGAERLCHVVVGADREADNGVDLGVTAVNMMT